MYHSITFGSMNTWDDWHLVPSSRPVIAPPKPKTQYVDIPGADGSIDVTEALAGRPVFGDREGSIELIVLNEFNVEAHGIDNYDYNWVDVFSGIMQYLHGRFMRMVLEDDPNYYYEGRFEVESWTTGQYNSSITIGYHLAPYKFLSSTTITANDLEVGGLTVNSITNPTTVSEISAEAMVRSNSYREFTSGETIRMSGNEHEFDILLYKAKTASGIQKYVPSSQIVANSFVFPRFTDGTNDGYFRINVNRKYDPTGERVSDKEIQRIANSILFHHYSEGVL